MIMATKKEMFAKIASAMENDAEIVAFCNHEIELLNNKKASKRTGPTKKQVENEGYKAEILNVLAGSDGLTATQVGAHFGWNGSQKASALLTQMEKAGAVVKSKNGKTTLFTVA